MKIKIALAAATLSLIGSTSANAAVIDITLNPSNVRMPVVGTTTGVDATLLYTGGTPGVSTIDIGSISVDTGNPGDTSGSITSQPGFDDFTLFSDQLTSGVPVDIETTYGAPAFNVTWSGATSPITDQFSIFVGIASSTDPPGTYSGTAELTVNATPEPGSLALLVTSGLGSGLALYRRRRK